jgi:uncharacterized protein YjbJ (UPF0337 family)
LATFVAEARQFGETLLRKWGGSSVEHLFVRSEITLEQQNPAKGTIMNTDVLKGNWKQFRGKIKEQWGKLTDDDLDMVEGRRDILVGRLQERYGWSRDEAERRYHEFEDEFAGHTM